MTMDVISVNIWQIIISLCNLLLLFLILKKFLFKPVKKTIEERRSSIESQYEEAEKAERSAAENQKAWESRLNSAKAEAESVLNKASSDAKLRGESIIEEANEKADAIMRRARNDAELEKRKAESEIKKEIIDVSAILTEKVIGRELNTEDHRNLIDSFIDEIGENDGSDK